MYAILEDGGRQYFVEPGTTVDLDLRKEAAPGQELKLDKVLLCADGQDVRVGAPYVKGAAVNAVVEGTSAGKKLYVVHFRRRKNSRSRVGHRQKYTAVRIGAIEMGAA